MTQTRKSYKASTKPKKKSLFRKTLKIIGLSTVLVMLVAGGAAAYFLSKMADVTASAQQELERGDRSEKRVEPVNPSNDNISILFLGLDDRDGDLNGRTDAILLATFNKGDGSIKMLSIPRDARVPIIGRDFNDKINHAHAFGGVDMTINTIEGLLDIPIDYFVKLNFKAFVEIIDALGGVEIDVPFAFTESDSFDRRNAVSLQKGLQTLNGEQALAYARMRKKDPRGDIGRGERQQEILQALIEKAASATSITRFNDIFDSVEDHLATNLSFGNIISLHSYATKLSDIDTVSLEGSNSMIGGVYYYELDSDSVAEVSKTLFEHLELDSNKVRTTRP